MITLKGFSQDMVLGDDGPTYANYLVLLDGREEFRLPVQQETVQALMARSMKKVASPAEQAREDEEERKEAEEAGLGDDDQLPPAQDGFDGEFPEGVTQFGEDAARDLPEVGPPLPDRKPGSEAEVPGL